jgi:hypothetical protein
MLDKRGPLEDPALMRLRPRQLLGGASMRSVAGDIMDSTKLTPNLIARLEESDPSEILDLILEMTTLSTPIKELTGLSRKERIAVEKAAFHTALTPIQKAICDSGGEVTGTLWLNHTLRVRIPAGAIKKLADLEIIASLDTPRPLETDDH